MWGLLPEKVLTEWRQGLQAADWYEGFRHNREELTRHIEALSRNETIARTLDLKRLQSELPG